MIPTKFIILGLVFGALIFSGVAQSAYSELKKTKSNIKEKTQTKAKNLSRDDVV